MGGNVRQHYRKQERYWTFCNHAIVILACSRNKTEGIGSNAAVQSTVASIRDVFVYMMSDVTPMVKMANRLAMAVVVRSLWSIAVSSSPLERLAQYMDFNIICDAVQVKRHIEQDTPNSKRPVQRISWMALPNCASVPALVDVDWRGNSTGRLLYGIRSHPKLRWLPWTSQVYVPVELNLRESHASASPLFFSWTCPWRRNTSRQMM